ncbi:hypothetical protein J6590_057331 [Homalodisca vitripennis]|nr:hypothetical protein J6590_057331 [Homalodisca vitripennis]
MRVEAKIHISDRVFHKMLYQAPSPQRKKEAPPKENKLRQFLKRSSEPLLNLQNTAAQRSYAQQLTPIQEVCYRTYVHLTVDTSSCAPLL